MVGTISFYDEDGKRMHTIYRGSGPEYGKEEFLKKMTLDVDYLHRLFPNTVFQGLADGAAFNWKWLDLVTDYQTLDFYHLSEYITKASHCVYLPTAENIRKQWFRETCHKIKHSNDGVYKLIDELRKIKIVNSEKAEILQQVICYLENQKHRTLYRRERQGKRPIGSGVTEAACKVLIKQRLCLSGQRWNISGAAIIITLRALMITHGRWNQFWKKFTQYGFFTGKQNLIH
jgi:hypothetical protein